MSLPMIRVEKLGKKYRIGSRQPPPEGWRQGLAAVAGAPFRYLREMSRPATEAETLWALRDVSFDVNQGDVIGIVGSNGAGKSTLLKILSRITEPTTGRAVIRGRIGSLLEIGTGFHPDLTGRENVFLNGTILGMRRAEIEAKFDEIVAFSEIEKFIDTPVKRYSSGMYVRLAFAVASHLEPEVLILDEVLAVGDAAFRRKCQDKMEEVARNGRTILFVSHNMNSIQTMCRRVIWFDHGSTKADGPAEEVVAAYLLNTDATMATAKSWDDQLLIERVEILDEAGDVTTEIPSGSDLTVQISYIAHSPVIRPYLWVGIAGHVGHLFTANMVMDGHRPERLEGRGQIRCRFSKPPLMPKQSYQILFGALEQDGFTILVPKTDVAMFTAAGTPEGLGFHGEGAERAIRMAASIVIPYRWELPDGQMAGAGQDAVASVAPAPNGVDPRVPAGAGPLNRGK